MDAPEFTARNAAKYAVKFIIQYKVKSTTKTVITDYTHYEKDDLTVQLSSEVVGWYVSDKLKPYTDKLVDKTADRISEFRADREAKKDTSEQ